MTQKYTFYETKAAPHILYACGPLAGYGGLPDCHYLGEGYGNDVAEAWMSRHSALFGFPCILEIYDVVETAARDTFRFKYRLPVAAEKALSAV